MERVDVKLRQWKAAYDALESARLALKRAVELGASNHEISELRAQVDRLQSESDSVLAEVGQELAKISRSSASH